MESRKSYGETRKGDEGGTKKGDVGKVRRMRRMRRGLDKIRGNKEEGIMKSVGSEGEELGGMKEGIEKIEI